EKKGRRRAELGETETDEERHGAGVARHLAAEAHGDAMTRAALGDGLDECKNGRMEVPESVRDEVVPTVHGERELGEVVRADREEVYLGREAVDEERYGGDLDHDPDVHLRAEGDALGREVFADGVEVDAEAADLVDRRNHREQNPHE